MKENKLCFIVSDVNESHQFNALFDGLKNADYDVSLIFIGAAYPEIGVQFAAKNFTVEFIECHGKRDFLKAFRNIYALLGKIKPNIVHTHLQTASLLGLTAAKLLGIKKRIYTRHHSTELHERHPHAVYYDKYCNMLSSHIIATSRNVRNVLVNMEKVDPTDVSIIHHGFCLEKFKSNSVIANKLETKYKLSGKYPVVGVISRFVEGKGIQYIIPAFAEVVKTYPNAMLVLAGASGDYTTQIRLLIEKYLKPENYVTIDFESFIFELYHNFDVFVHVPINAEFEAFGQTYVEALALEIPSVFTLSGIASDFIVDRRNAIVVDFCNSHMIANAIKEIIENKELRERIVKQGKTDVEKLFNIDKMVNLLEKVYFN